MDSILAETMQILVVDDDDVDRERVARFLRHSPLKAEATEASSGQEALALLKSRPFDCVVLDNQLRDGLGSELLPSLQADAGRACPLIMVTGAGDEELAARVMREGAADYLAKSRLSSDVLTRAIERSVETSRLQEQLRVLGQALAANEAKYRAIVEDQVELVCLAQPDLTISYANAAYAAHHGLTPDQMVGNSLLDYVPAADRDLLCAHLEGVCRSTAAQRLECRSMSAVASVVRWVAWTNRAIRNADGHVTSLHSVGRDVTDQVQGRESAARLAAIVNSSADAIVSTDLQGIVTTWNRAAEHLFGYRARDAIGQAIDTIVPPDRLVEEGILAQRVRNGEAVVEFQTVRMRRNAINVEVACTLSPIRDAHGSIVGISRILRDIGERRRLERALHDSERQYRELYEETPAMLHSVDAAGRLLSVSDTWLIQLGYVRNEVLGRSFMDFLPAPARQRVREELLPRLLQAGRCERLECQVLRSNGTAMDVLLSARLERDASGNPGRTLAVLQDVSERNRLAEVLDAEHERLRVTLRSIGDAVITTDREGRVAFLNPVAEELTGWPDAEARGRPVEQVFHVVGEESHRDLENPVTRSLAQDRPVALPERSLLIARDGNEYGIEDSTAPIRDAQGNSIGAVVVFHDVTEQRRLSAQMRFRASHDPLTGLLNRAEFELRLTRALGRAREGGRDMALLFVDLDQFKQVNDACGHAVGDRLLRQLGGALQRCIRDRDTLARLGGDEFGIILEHCPVEQAHRIAQQVCERIEAFRFVHEQRRYRLGVSIGLVGIDAHWPSEAALLAAADAACYAAKEAGRNRVHAWRETDALGPVGTGEIHWAKRIEHALAEDRFVLHAQRVLPLRGLGTGLRCEVLVRMVNPDGTLVLPGAMLPAAERLAIAPRIDRWVLRRVLEWMAQNRDALGAVDLVSVNLSGQSLADPAFHRYAADLVGAHFGDGRKLGIEITEGVAVANLHDATELMGRLRALGVRVALDDFGSGVAGFSYLKGLPIDTLKIDARLIRGMAADPLDAIAVRGLREVAGVLGVRTVASCVESVQLREPLAALGIDYAQGYAFHRPEPLATLLAGHALPHA